MRVDAHSNCQQSNNFGIYNSKKHWYIYIYIYSTLPRVGEVDKLIRIELCYVTYKGETYTVNKNVGVVSRVPYKIPPPFVQFTVHKNWMNESIN